MKKRDNGFKIIAVIALVLAVAGLSIAYASFTSNLTINGTATVSSNWNIEWQNLNGSVVNYASIEDANLSIQSGNQAILGTIGNLFAPGDSITWTWEVKNKGTINAKLTGLTLANLTCSPVIGGEATQEEATALCNDIDLTFTYAGSSISAISDVDSTNLPLVTNNYKTVSMMLSYSSTSMASISGPVTVCLDSTPTFTYTQDDSI